AQSWKRMIARINGWMGRLTLVAGRDGQVAGGPPRSTLGQWPKPGRPADHLGDSSASPDAGARPDKPYFCEIGDPHQLEAHMILDQTDIHLIRPGRQAWLKVYGKAQTTYRTTVAEIAPHSRAQAPLELPSLAEGEVASNPAPKTGPAKPVTAVYEVIIPVDNPNLELQPGLRGFAKIDGGSYRLAWWLWRWWKKVF